MQKMENITIALEFIKAEGIQLVGVLVSQNLCAVASNVGCFQVNVGTDDVAGGNIRLLLLIFCLVFCFDFLVAPLYV